MTKNEQLLREALNRMDALLDPESYLLAVPDNSATRRAAISDMKLIRTALAQPAEPLSPLLVRDVAELIGSTVPDVCKALVQLGHAQSSTNMAIHPEDAIAVAKLLAQPAGGGEVARPFRAALMGHGRVAIGQCKDQKSGTPGIIYLDMGDEQRAIDSDTSDLFSPGSVADESKVLACVYFATPEAVHQSITVLHELLADQFGVTAPPASHKPTGDKLFREFMAEAQRAGVTHLKITPASQEQAYKHWSQALTDDLVESNDVASQEQPKPPPMTDEQLMAAFAKLYLGDAITLEVAKHNSECRVSAIGARRHWREFVEVARAIEARHDIK